MNFNIAFNRLIDTEKGLSMREDDPGNWTGGKIGAGVLKGTKYGIAANTYPDEDIQNLTLERAKFLYRRDFWDKLQGDKVYDGVAFQVFDAAVNHGGQRAIKLLQKSLGLKEDGNFGPISIAACNAKSESDVIVLFLAERIDFMTGLSNWPTASRGWSRRIATNLRFGAQDS